MSEELKSGPAGEEASQEQESAAVNTTEDSAPPAEAPEKVEDAPAADEPAAEASLPVEAVAEEQDPNEPIGPRWFSVRTSSQPEPINLLLRDAVRDHVKNEQSVIERFKLGHGITDTPHKLYVGALPADYVPTARDVDHHEAIESALSASVNQA